jgi:hypothetical protein
MARALPELDGVEHRFVDLPNLRMHGGHAHFLLPDCG